jgi:hypothetical protein
VDGGSSTELGRIVGVATVVFADTITDTGAAWIAVFESRLRES